MIMITVCTYIIYGILYYSVIVITWAIAGCFFVDLEVSVY